MEMSDEKKKKKSCLQCENELGHWKKKKKKIKWGKWQLVSALASSPNASESFFLEARVHTLATHTHKLEARTSL